MKFCHHRRGRRCCHQQQPPSAIVVINGIVVCIVIISVGIISYSHYYDIRAVPVVAGRRSSSNDTAASKNDTAGNNYSNDDDRMKSKSSASSSSPSSSTTSSPSSSSQMLYFARHRKQFHNDLGPGEQNQLMSTEEYWDEWIQYGFEQRRRRRRRKQQNRDDQYDDYYDKFYQLDEMKKQWMSGATSSPMGFPLVIDGWDVVDNVTCVGADDDGNNSRMRWNDVRAPVGIVLGTQKGGSTALNNFLQQHPRVAPTFREIHFLSGDMDRLITGTYSKNKKNKQQQQVDRRDITSTDRYYRNPIHGGINQTASQDMYLETLTNYVKSDAVERKRIRNEQLFEETNNDELYGRPMLMVDKSPSYVVQSDRVPYRILCTCPWAKLVLLLRDPISRAYSQYNMIRHSKNKQILRRIPPTFDEWVEQDYQILTKLGVLRPIDDGENNDTDDSSDTEHMEKKTTTGVDEGYRGTLEEKRGWKAYTRLAALGSTGPIGRGLYSIQISQWIEAYKQNGRDLLGSTASSSSLSSTTTEKGDNNNPGEKTLLVLSSDFTKSNPDEAFGLVCDHFGLPRVPLSSSSSNNTTSNEKKNRQMKIMKKNKQRLTRGGGGGGGTNQGRYDDGVVEPMSNKTREKLRRIFEPYNRQLADLLGDDEWKDIWT